MTAAQESPLLRQPMKRLLTPISRSPKRRTSASPASRRRSRRHLRNRSPWLRSLLPKHRCGARKARCRGRQPRRGTCSRCRCRHGASYAQLVAPFDAVVTERAVEPGTMATPGTPLLFLEDPADQRLEASVDESRAAWTRPGQSVDVSLDAEPEQPVESDSARIAEVGPRRPRLAYLHGEDRSAVGSHCAVRQRRTRACHRCGHDGR